MQLCAAANARIKANGNRHHVKLCTVLKDGTNRNGLREPGSWTDLVPCLVSIPTLSAYAALTTLRMFHVASGDMTPSPPSIACNTARDRKVC